jgi:hypothetical protein
LIFVLLDAFSSLAGFMCNPQHGMVALVTASSLGGSGPTLDPRSGPVKCLAFSLAFHPYNWYLFSARA